MTCSLTGSYRSVGTYSQLQGIMENWDILLFLLQSSLYLSAFLTLLSLLFSLFFFLLLSPIHPSLPIFSQSPSLPFICLSPPSSSPSSLVSHLNCSAHRRTRSGPSPCRLYCQHQFCCKERRQEERKEQQEKRGNCRDLSFPFIVSSQWGSVTPTGTAERKREELCSVLIPDAPV